MRIRRCRICKNAKLEKIGSLGKIAISNFTQKPSEGHKMPLELVYCTDCTLLQLAHNPDRDLMYKNYWYESRLNPVIVNDLKEIASQGLALGGFTTQGSDWGEIRDSWVDIGSNDGTLQSFLPKSVHSIAVDPSNIENKHAETIINDYFEDIDTSSAKVITAIACMYDLPDPNKFMRNIKKHLAVDGVFIAQLMTLKPMIDNADVGNICHEHIEYYSYKSLVRLYEQNGLEIFKVEKNSINGGSYRIFARHYQKGSIKFREKEYSLDELKDFFARIEKNRADFWRWLKSDKRNLPYIYGASTKANTILQYYGINHGLAIDVNPRKQGHYMINSQIIITDKVPEDGYLWVMPYGFLPYFKERENNFKGKWVTVFPKFKIL